MKVLIPLIIIFFIPKPGVFGQLHHDSIISQKVKANTLKADTLKADTLKVGTFKNDSLKAGTIKPDSINIMDDTIAKSLPKTYQSILKKLLLANKLVTNRQKPVFLVIKKKETNGKELLFYALSAVILVFGFFKVFYSRYFNNIFRVFFNTSLRQNQLTDLLLQARLPSLIFNIFFTVTAGLYIWLLIPHYYQVENHYDINVLLFCIGGIGVIYIARFCLLKFVGWVTGLPSALNTYIFVIFLINKIIGIALIPLILILAFASPVFFKTTALISMLSFSVFFLVRFFRSYSLLQQQLNISMFHFLLYVISLEILPLLVIYKLSLKLFLRI